MHGFRSPSLTTLREGGRERGREGEGDREGRTDGGRDGGAEGGREGGREGGSQWLIQRPVHQSFGLVKCAVGPVATS